MKAKNSTRFLFLLVILIAVFSSACGIAQQGIDRYETMKAAYLQVSNAIANFQLSTDTNYAKMRSNFQVYEAAIENNEAAIAAWSQVEKSVQDSGAAVANSTTSAGVLDVSKLVESNALPTNGIPNLALNVNSYTSAIADIRLDSSVIEAMMDTNNEALNSIQASGFDWNAAVLNYNTIRSEVGNEVVARIVNELGLASLPLQLNAYVGANANQPIGNPLAPTAPQ